MLYFSVKILSLPGNYSRNYEILLYIFQQILFNHVLTYCYRLGNWQWLFACARTYNNQVHACCCNITVQSCYFFICWQHILSCINNTVDSSSNNVFSSSHKQSVPACMRKPDNNTVQAGQLNHVHACQQTKTSSATDNFYPHLIMTYLGFEQSAPSG